MNFCTFFQFLARKIQTFFHCLKTAKSHLNFQGKNYILNFAIFLAPKFKLFYVTKITNFAKCVHFHYLTLYTWKTSQQNALLELLKRLHTTKKEQKLQNWKNWRRNFGKVSRVFFQRVNNPRKVHFDLNSNPCVFYFSHILVFLIP